MPQLKCPNCGSPVVLHPSNGCALAALVSMLRDRGELDQESLYRIHANCDVSRLWDVLGPILDDLGEGAYLMDVP